MSENKLLVRKIKDGIVIDHIPAGFGVIVAKVLGLITSQGTLNKKLKTPIVILMNVESKKLGRKDLLKIEGFFLNEQQINKIVLIAPMVTINIIKDWNVKRKFRAIPPKTIKGLLRCPNHRCITNRKNEPIKPTFELINDNPLIYKCIYCDTTLNRDEIISQLLT